MVVDTGRALRYAITDLAAYPLDCEAERRLRLLRLVRHWTFDGVDIVQLREKEMEIGTLLSLAEAAMEALREVDRGMGTKGSRRKTRLLVNARADVAAAAGADGVHLTSRTGELTPAQVRRVFASTGLSECLVSVSCHTAEDVVRARDGGADLLLWGPVFEKRFGEKRFGGKRWGEGRVAPGQGLAMLQEVCRLAAGTPVLALGGVTVEQAPACLAAGAAGIAGIRLFAAPDAP